MTGTARLLTVLLAVLGAALPAVAAPPDEICPAARAIDSYDTPNDGLIVPGRPGWLFRTSSDLMMDFALEPETKILLGLIEDRLAARGVRLVLAILPTRGMIHADAMDAENPLFRAYDRQRAVRGYGRLLDVLRATGSIVPDILAAAQETSLEDPFFLRRDHHWSVAGARAAARAIAGAIKADPAYAALPKVSHGTRDTGWTFDLGETYAEILAAVCGRPQPAPRQIAQWRTEVVGRGLLDDRPRPPVVVVGTSNSNKNDRDDFNFAGFLADALDLDVENAALSGGGVEESIVAWLRDDFHRQPPPAFLVWEMPAYYNLNDSAALRQVVAAAGGDCPGTALATGSAEAGGGEIALIRDLPAGIGGPGYHVRIETSDPGLRRFEIGFRHGDRTEWLDIRRAPAVAHDGVTSVSLSPTIAEPLTGIDLRLPDGTSGTVEARLCRAVDRAT